jgi:hypothetical protein
MPFPAHDLWFGLKIDLLSFPTYFLRITNGFFATSFGFLSKYDLTTLPALRKSTFS